MIRRHPLLLFFVLAYAISWLIWSPLWLPHFGILELPVLPFHHALGALGPIVAAFTVTALETGRVGLVDLARRMWMWRDQVPWIVFALCAPIAMLALGMLSARLAGVPSAAWTDVGKTREFPQFSAIGFLGYNIFTFGYGEETGWRGFALPRLQARHSAFVSTLLLTGGWAIWHIPLFLYRPGYVTMGVAGILGWLFSLVTGAVLLTWLFNASRGSILVVAIFHATVDVAFTSSTSPFVVNVVSALITVLGLVVLVREGPRHLSRKGMVVQSREPSGGSGTCTRHHTRGNDQWRSGLPLTQMPCARWRSTAHRVQRSLSGARRAHHGAMNIAVR
ncbi:MAG: type II CAAX endopeptidase family protein [Gemmatimonadaceae bacterium]